MFFHSTRDDQKISSLSYALLHGLSEDGGLIIPDINCIPKINIDNLRGLNYKEIAFIIIDAYFHDLGDGLKQKIYNNYDGYDDLLILRELNDAYVLELFNAQTGAFKDVALSLLPHLMQLATMDNNEILMLTATSGDTGKAALEAFKNIPNIKVMVFYPQDGVSNTQKLQMQTQEGNNLSVIAIKGNFDNAQKAVKEAFSDASIKALANEQNTIISSCNSINIGRLIPQIVYYFYSYIKLLNDNKINSGEKINFAVPSGNFGNVLGGFYAKKMGLPIGDLIIGSNDNKVLHDFIQTGIYDTNRDFYKTIAPSMDILVSSNVERLLYNIIGTKQTKIAMDTLKVTGKYAIDVDKLSDFKSDFCTEDNISKTICKVYAENNYIIDTHTACAYYAATKCSNEYKTIILATASPYKFPVDIVSALKGQVVNEDEAVDFLNKAINRLSPNFIKSIKTKPILHKEIIEIDEINKTIMKFMR